MFYATAVNPESRLGQSIIADYHREGYGSIWQAYGRPSYYKERAYTDIEARARATDGYNHDLRVSGKNCMQFTTIYSYMDDFGHLHIVKDTAQNTYEVIL